MCVQLKVLTLDSRVSSPTVAGLETCTALEELSLNKCGIKSLVGFPMLPVLKVRARTAARPARYAARCGTDRSESHPMQVLRLSDNLIADGLGALADAELQNLQELDLSGNKVRARLWRRPSCFFEGALMWERGEVVWLGRSPTWMN